MARVQRGDGPWTSAAGGRLALRVTSGGRDRPPAPSLTHVRRDTRTRCGEQLRSTPSAHAPALKRARVRGTGVQTSSYAFLPNDPLAANCGPGCWGRNDQRSGQDPRREPPPIWATHPAKASCWPARGHSCGHSPSLLDGPQPLTNVLPH